MPTSLTRDQLLQHLRSTAALLAERAAAAGLDARVPTCPGWDVADLVAHQSMVHRWATAHVRGTSRREVPDEQTILATQRDLLGYYQEGYAGLLDALDDAPADLDAKVFLLDAPAPREFWTRRQAHETCIHGVDAVAATLGRIPRAAEVPLEASFALDGIDELVCGFLPRERSSLHGGAPVSVLLAPSDNVRRWTIRVGPDEAVTDQGQTVDRPTVTFSGLAVQLYLGLWNRGDEIHAEGEAAILERWRETERVTWS